MTTLAPRRRSARLISLLATVLLGFTAVGLPQPAQATSAGTPDTAFNAQFLPAPILDERVNTTVEAGDGSVFIGGQFTGGLKKLNADGSLNTAFNANVANSLFGCTVFSIALTAGGSPIVGCGYNVNNVYLNKFDAAGNIDATFAANVGATLRGQVFTVLVSSSGEIYAGGDIPGHLKKFSSNGTPDTTFTANVGSSLNNYASDLMEMPDGSILAAGDFTGKVKMFNSDGTTTGTAATFNTNVTGAIPFQGNALALTTDGSILVGCSDGAKLYKINSDGTTTGTTATFNANVGSSINDIVWDIKVLSDASIVIGGRFTDRLKKLNSDGSATGTAATFNRAVSGRVRSEVFALAIGTSDRIYVGGGFDERMISFNADGSRTGATGAFNTIVAHQPVGVFNVVAPSGDGGFLAGGDVPGRIMKFASDGSPDINFNTNIFGAINTSVEVIAVACDGSLIIGGNGFVAKINADGTSTGSAATFNANVAAAMPNSGVKSIKILGDGSVIVGGDFTNHLIMFNADGTVNASFNSNVISSGVIDGRVAAIHSASDGSLIVGGEFTGALKKLNSDGTVHASSFNGNVISSGVFALYDDVEALSVTSDGSLIVSGYFTDYVKKFNADGTVHASTFNSNVIGVFDRDPITISLANDGSMILGGGFTDYVKKLNADGTSTTGDAATFNAGIAAQSNDYVESSMLTSDGGVIVVGANNVPSIGYPAGQIVVKFFGAGFPVTTTPGAGSCRSVVEPGGGPSSDSTPSTPVVRAPAVLGPVPLGTSILPPNGVTPGSSVLLVNGVPQSVTVKPDAPVTSQAKGLVATGDGFTLKLAGVDDRGQSLGLTNDAALVLRRDNSALVEGTGFAPNNDVQVYIFSQPRLLGTISTNSTGSFSGLVPVPADLAIGPHTMQINAFNTDGTVRSLSLGVVLQAPKVAANQKTARASVVFDAGSARLSPQAKKALTTLARRVGATATGGMVVGYVQRDRNYASDEQLSIQRAKSVAKFLRLRGVKGTLVTRGNGALSGSETARKAVVTVRYTV